MISIETYADLPRKLGHHGFIVLALLQAADMMGIQPVTAQWLHDHAPGYGKGSITDALRILTSHEFQLAVRVTGGWVINRDNAFQLPLGYALTDGESEPEAIEETSQSNIENRSESENRSGRKNRSESENRCGSDSCIEILGQNRSESDFQAKKQGSIKRIEEESQLIQVFPPQSEPADEFPTLEQLFEHLDLIFQDPKTHVPIEPPGVDQVPGGTPARLALAWIVKAYVDRDRLTKSGPMGLVLARLKSGTRRGLKLSTAQERLPDEYLDAIGLLAKRCDHCGQIFRRLDAWQTHQSELETVEFEDETSDVDELHVELQSEADASVTERIRQGWQSLLGQLEMEMPRASFDTWVRDTVPLRLMDDRLIVATRNSYGRDWLDSRVKSTCERLLVGLLDAQLTVEFVVAS